MDERAAIQFARASRNWYNPRMQKRVAIYTRVSTSDGKQTIDNQLHDLNLAAERLGWNVVAHFSDEGISGAKGRDRRSGLDAMLKAIARKEFDMVAAWSVCRLGRSLQHLVSLLGDLNAKDIDLYLHVQALDTSTPSGRAMFQMLGVFSEFERAMISDRVRTALAATKKPLGRKPLNPQTIAKVEKTLRSGKSINATAKALKIGVGSVHRIKVKMADVFSEAART
ncbi:MAG: recombinase family protein [Pontixanthobacter sp.]